MLYIVGLGLGDERDTRCGDSTPSAAAPRSTGRRTRPSSHLASTRPASPSSRSCTERRSRPLTGRWWRSALTRCCARLPTLTLHSSLLETLSGNYGSAQCAVDKYVPKNRRFVNRDSKEH